MDAPAARIRLARLVRGDREEMVRGNRDSVALHHPWIAPFIDAAAFDAWFDRVLTGPHVALVAREVAPGAPVVGVVNLNEIVVGVFLSAYLGYWGMASGVGRGLMTEAVAAAVAFGFDQLGLHRLEANIQPGNARSIALVRRIGFQHEGFSPRYLRIDGAWRDHERWAILADAPGRPPPA
jgi:ribosomal-protein-alanine N-acetyltransferase